MLSQAAVSGEFSSPSRLRARDRGSAGAPGRVKDSCQEVELVDRVVDYRARGMPDGHEMSAGTRAEPS